ncbi:hypothetical protein C0J52_06455 [Blattella germanica]|nr:hypothetical protein C0J52_06455 [Blattella germanica]
MTRKGKTKKEKHKKILPSVEEKEAYLKKATEFAESLVATLQNPDANCEESADKDVTEKQKNQKAQFPRGLQKRKCKEFEDFVLENRKYLREELHLCERGVQKVLMYSNNFLHKKLKTSPNRSCRLERSIGKNARGVLKPISELINEPCCSDKCVAMAQTHSKLLEDWRNIAKKGQREARRVLAEMLTPSGGTKANCYKFISMVTGDHTARAGNSDEDDPDVVMDVASIHIPTREELETLCPQEATTQLQLQREKLLEAQKQLLEQQAQLQQQLKQTKSKSNGNKHFTTNTEKTIPIPVLTTHSPFENRNIETMTVLTPAETNETSAEILARSTTQRVLHILELPTSSPSDLSVNLEGRGPTTFSNVVILPEATIETSTISASTAAQGTSVISYSPPVDNVGAVISSQEQQTNTVVDTSLETGPDVTKPTSEVGTFQFYGVMDAAASNLLHFNY